ncbi:leukocyte elastase inhibitor-like [Saccostrea cucullata]|uniref:leukocyte elastase inhibitor-like n=1 Tax=Saccostrea cuccullata TaxID=36930 RepID=UPI002ED5B62D
MESVVANFSLRLYNVLSEGNDNLILSPYSVTIALMLTMLGTKGESEAQIKQVLGLSGIPDPHKAYKDLHFTLTGKYKEGTELAIANRIYSKLGLHIRESYKQKSIEVYNSELELLDFVGNPEGSRSIINTWVEEQTNNKIKDLIPPGVINNLTVAVLANAIYFKGDWENPFKSSETEREKFYISEIETEMIDMMHMGEKKWLISVSESLDCKVLNLPYKGEELSMLIFLPNKIDGLSEVESNLSPEILYEITQKLYYKGVIVTIPKFKLESSFEIVNVLAGMGITDIFSKYKSDFSAMMDNPPEETYVSGAIHKAFVEVNEEGTEAAAVMALTVSATCYVVPDPPVIFKADHPFLFLIRENSTGTVLFIGRFTKPT